MSLAITERRSVPDWVDLRPALCSTASAALVSSNDTPSAAVAGIAYFMPWPNWRTDDVDMFAALTNTSEMRPKCSTLRPACDIVFASNSDDSARSSCPACASFSAVGVAFSTALTSRPAAARFFCALAASAAENDVAAPSNFACSRIFPICSAVASEMAAKAATSRENSRIESTALSMAASDKYAAASFLISSSALEDAAAMNPNSSVAFFTCLASIAMPSVAMSMYISKKSPPSTRRAILRQTTLFLDSRRHLPAVLLWF